MSRGIEGIKEGHTTHQVEKKPLSLQYILKGHEDHKGELNGDRGDTGPDSTGVGDGKSDPDSHKPNTTEQSKLEQSGMPKPNDKQYNVGEAKGLDLHEYERNIVFPQENVHREEINTLFTTTLNEAISEKSNFKGLLEDAIRPKLDVENMRAFWHNKTGRILIGSAEHVSKIFENYGIVNQGLGTLKVGDKNNGITRIRIDDSLVNNILKKKGFKFDITKPGAHGELEKIATVHAKYNEDEDKMDVDFKEYEKHSTDHVRSTSGHAGEQSHGRDDHNKDTDNALSGDTGADLVIESTSKPEDSTEKPEDVITAPGVLEETKPEKEKQVHFAESEKEPENATAS